MGLLHKSEDALNYSRPVIMAIKESRSELEVGYGRRNVKQSLVIIWSAVTKVVTKNKRIADIIAGAKATSKARKILNSMVEGDRSERARE